MTEILLALGKRAGGLQKACLVLAFCAATCSVLLVGHAIHYLLGLDMIAIHLLSWVAWFCWQANFTPVHHHSLSGVRVHNRYREAFYRHILFGVSFGVAQMVRPLFFAVGTAELLPNPNALTLIVSATTLCGGILLLYHSFSAIGMAAAGFLFEYQPEAKALMTSGIYATIRHPLFFGGVLASVGVALLYANWICIFMALSNIVILPIYRSIEDRRSLLTMGEEYAIYISSVPAFMPGATPFWKLMPFSSDQCIDL